MTYTSNLNKTFAENIIDTSFILDASVDWIASHLSPEDVFDQQTLEDWALSNGFIMDKLI